MENPIKSQISKIFKSTFNPCLPNNTSDVSDHRLFRRRSADNRRLIDLFSPKPLHQSASTSQPKPHLSRLGNFPFSEISDRRNSHSVSSINEKPSKSDRKKKAHRRRIRNNATFSTIADNNYYHNWWSDEGSQSDGKSTQIFWRSTSYDSNERIRENILKIKDRNATDVVALAKDSNDPYEDFKSSMVDMIVKNEIFGVEELENLVECFVSLNSEEHHKVIFEVFAEIWDILIAHLNKRG